MSEEIHDAELVEDDGFLQGEKVGFGSQTNIGKMVALGLVALLLSSTILYTILSEDDEKQHRLKTKSQQQTLRYSSLMVQVLDRCRSNRNDILCQ
ncbi:MAG: hypothetical protein CM15mP9_1910 [Methanobacteriota archaeon]|nr:MAG: hypothetical protein CM15mP9_1910 [Euryarchaeota archaeon]